MPVHKSTAPPDWDDLRYFLALVRHRSLSATARALKVNHVTVARRIAHLEAALGVSLFDRRADGYVLTAKGHDIETVARAMEDAALAVGSRVEAGDEVGGLIRLAATRSLADDFLIDRLAGFHRSHPGIDLEIVTGSRVLSLWRREADIALRFGRPAKGELLARKVATVGFGFYAARGIARAVAKGERPPIIAFDEDSQFVADAAWLTREFAGTRVTVRANSQTSQAAAARAGFGLALLPHFLGRADSRLVEVRLDKKPPDRELWLLLRPDMTKVPRVRAMADFLAALFKREREVLAGRATK